MKQEQWETDFKRLDKNLHEIVSILLFIFDLITIIFLKKHVYIQGLISF